MQFVVLVLSEITCFISKTDIPTFKLKTNSNVGLHEVNEAEGSSFSGDGMGALAHSKNMFSSP